MKSGTIFDNLLITDDEEFAEEVGNDTWGETKDPEKKMKDAVSLSCYGTAPLTPSPLPPHPPHPHSKTKRSG